MWVFRLTDGGWLVTWLSYNQDGSAGGIYQQRYTSDGSKSGGESRVNTTTSADQESPSVTALADGGWLVSWQSNHQDGSSAGIYQQRFAADAQPLGGWRVNAAASGTLSITGTTAQNQTLNLVDALTDADGLGARTYTWKDGSGNTLGTGTTLAITEAQVGKQISVSATYTDGHGNLESSTSALTAMVANVNDAPTGSVTITGTAAQNQTLSAEHTLIDADGLGLISYTWKDGSGNTLGSGSSLALTQAHVGKTISAIATYTDGHGTIESSTSAATAIVSNVNDAPAGNLSISGSAAQGNSLSVVDAITDADGKSNVTYTWKDGTGNTLGSGSSLALTEAQVGKQISVTATYTDAQGTAESVISTLTATVTNVNDAPSGTLTISGSAAQGNSLSVVDAITDTDGKSTVTYTWKDGSGNSLGSGSSLALTQIHVGKSISVTAAYTDGHGTPETVTSAATASVSNVNDLPVFGTILGSATQGQTLSAPSLSDADGLPLANAITYTWKDAAGNTLGSGSSLTLGEIHVGKTISVTASYTDLLGTPETTTSTFTSAVTNVNDAPAGSLTISGTASQGKTLSVVDAITDADGLTDRSYTWKDGSGNTLGSGSSLILTQALVGKEISVTASYTDSHGTVESVSSTATAAVLANIPATATLSFSGNIEEGGSVTAAVAALTDADGTPSISSYQWQSASTVGGTYANISGATNSTYSIPSDQSLVGQYLRFSITTNDGTVLSSSGSLVSNVEDAATASLSISGSAQKGGEVSALVAALSDDDGTPSIVSYAWEVSDTANGAYSAAPGTATTSSYTIPSDQSLVGKFLRFTITTNDGTVLSSSGSLVNNVNYPTTATLSISGSTQEGGEVTAAVAALTDADGTPSIVSYQWQSASTVNGTYANISSATSSSYSIHSDQSFVGQYLRFTITTNDGTVLSSSGSLISNVDDAASAILSITGTSQEGGNVSASVASLVDADGAPTVATYQWQSASTLNGIYADISGATSISYSIPSDQSLVGKFLRYTITTSDALGGSTTLSSAGSLVNNVNDPATANLGIFQTVPEGVAEGAAVAAVVASLSDDDGTPSVVSYAWEIASTVNGSYSAAPGTANTANYSIPSDQSLVGKYLRLSITTNDGTVLSSTGSLVNNIDDAATATLSISGTTQEGGSVSASVASLVDVDGSPAVASYQWQSASTLNGTYANISGANSSTYSIPSDQSLVGQYLRFTITTSDVLGGSTTLSSTGSLVSNVNDASVLSITGDATQNKTLSANLSDADGLPVSSSISYTWKDAAGNILGSGVNLTLSQAHVGKQISVSASYTDAFGQAESVSSALTASIANVNDAPTGNVSITGIAAAHQTLRATNTLADIDGLGPINYTWKDEAGNILGTNPTFTLGLAQSGKTLTVVASYLDAYGTHEQVSSLGRLMPDLNDIDVTATTNAQTNPALTALTDGGWIVTWESFGQDAASSFGVYQQRYNSNSTKNGSEIRVNTVTAGNQQLPAVTALSDGGWVLTWQSNGQDAINSLGIYQQRYDSSGAKSGGEILVNTTTAGDQQDSAVTALTDGGWLVAWESYLPQVGSYVLYQQRFTSGGVKSGSETLVSSNFSNASAPTLTALADGGWVVAWDYSTGIYQQRYTSSGAKSGSEITVTTVTGLTMDNTSVTALTDGGWVVTWQSYGQDAASTYGIYQQRFAANGNRVGGELLVNTTTAGAQQDPSVTALADGGWLISWESFGQDAVSTYGIYQQRYSAAGVKSGSETLVNAITAGSQQSSAVTALNDGGWIAAWQTDYDGIHQQRFDAEGNVATAPLPVITNAVPTGSVSISGTPRQGQTLSASNTLVDADGLGSISYTWQNLDGTVLGQASTLLVAAEQAGQMIALTASYTDGHGHAEAVTKTIQIAPVGEVKVSIGTDYALTPVLSALANGGWIAAWRAIDGSSGGDYGIYQHRYDSNGNALGDSTRVNTVTANTQELPAVTALADGGWVLTWQSYGQDATSSLGIYQQRYDSSGAKSGGEILVNTTTAGDQQDSAVTALTDGGWLVAWESYLPQVGSYVLYQQRFTSGGVKSGSETLVSSNFSNASAPTLTALADGGWVVAWDYSTGIYQQRYTSSGAKSGSEITVTTVTGLTMDNTSVTALTDGGWVVTWQSYGQDAASTYGIYQQRFAANGNRVGGELLVNTTTAGAQQDPSVTALADGGWLISWESFGQDAVSTYGIYQQRYSAAGVKSGSETLVNAITAGSQQSSAVTALNDGGWIAAWQTDYDGIHQQRFDAEGTPNGGWIGSNHAPTGSLSIIDSTPGDAAKLGDLLSIGMNNFTDVEGVGPFTRQWQRDGADISGATEATYLLGAVDSGRQISVRGSYTDGHGYSELINSNLISIV